MALTARALFDFCVRARDSEFPAMTGGAMDVTGTVLRAALGHDGTPIIWLEAEGSWNCSVECRCLSDEVLLKARPGSEITLEGFCIGLEDSVTVVLDRCELLAADGRRGPASARLTGRAGRRSIEPVPHVQCSFCGRHGQAVHRLVTIGAQSICDRCVGEYSLRLRAELDPRADGAGRGRARPAPRSHGRVSRLFGRWRRALASLLRQGKAPEPTAG